VPETGPAIDLPTPLPQGRVVTIAVSSDPPGARIYLDNTEVAGGVVTIPADGGAKHTVVAESACFVDRASVKAGDPESLVIPLKTPRLEKVQITSDPPGAAIFVDGKSAGARTPSEINLATCRAHEIEARLDGYKAASSSFGEETDWVAQRSVSLRMDKLPDGFVSVKGPYPLQVFEGGREVGESGKAIRLQAGTHTLTFINKALFVKETADVEVPPDGTVSPRVRFPGVGRITVFANPSSGEVHVNDRKIGTLPLNDYELAEGTYTVKYLLPSGQSDVKQVLVMEGQRETVKFVLK
jgi:hypothetical protein